MYLDAGTQFFSDVNVQVQENIQHPSSYWSSSGEPLYEGRVDEWGVIERSIPVPSGLFQVGNATVKLIDTDQFVRHFMASKTSLRRLCEILIGDEDTPHSLFQTAYIGEIVDGGTKFGPGYAIIEMRDIHSRWLDQYIPPLITRTGTLDSGEPVGSTQDIEGSGAAIALFPNMPLGVDSIFAPIVFGSYQSPADNMQGVLPLQLVDTTRNRYCVSRTPVNAVTTVYRKRPGEEIFSIVEGEGSAAEYVVVAEPLTIEGINYTFTWLDFFEAQPEGTQIRIDLEGINGRGQFGPIEGVSGVLRNPVDALINLIYYATLKEPVAARYDFSTWSSVRDLCETLGYYCDGPITESVTWRVQFSKLCSNFGIDLFSNKLAQLSLALTIVSDPARPVFTDAAHVLKESAQQGLASPAFNRIRYRFAKNAATRAWGSEDLYNNATDQAALGEIQETLLELDFVSDVPTARAVATDRGKWYDLDAHRFECDLPAAAVLDDLELAKLVGFTHFEGLTTSGGWINEQFKLHYIALNLNTLKVQVKAIRYPATPTSARPATAYEYEDEPPVNPARSHVDNGPSAIDGNEDTYASVFLVNPNGVASYAHLWIYDFPAPVAGATLASATIYVTAEYIVGTAWLGHFPNVQIDIFNAYTNDEAGINFITHRVHALYGPPGGSNSAKAEYSKTFTASEFQSSFSGSAANIYLRAEVWSAILDSFSPACELRVYGCRIEYTYA